MSGDALPSGYSFVVDDESSTPVEPILIWLVHAYPPKTRKLRRSTVEAAAYDLCDWWRYLEVRKLVWNEVDSEDLVQYRDSLLSAVSPRTRQAYDEKTIGRRLYSIGSFYDWALQRKLFLGEGLNPPKISKVIRSIDSDALIHTRGKGLQTKGHALAPRVVGSPDEHVHPLTGREWRSVASVLGPLPSERATGAVGMCRDRLASEVSVWTGMRSDEVAGLTRHQILDLPRGDDPHQVIALSITHTKGLAPRTVLIPTHLVNELIEYIDTERAESVSFGLKFELKKDPVSLFVNGVGSRHDSGSAIKAYTLSAAFKSAVLAAGLTRRVERINLETSESVTELVSAHSFHDLRHTFAVWLYQAEAASGNPEPWKVVQARLGHKYLKTTCDTYLRVVDTFRANANDSVYRFLRGAFGA